MEAIIERQENTDQEISGEQLLTKAKILEILNAKIDGEFLLRSREQKIASIAENIEKARMLNTTIIPEQEAKNKEDGSREAGYKK